MLSMKSFASRSSVNDTVSRADLMISNVAMYKGGLVAIRHINKPHIQLTRHDLLELKQVKDNSVTELISNDICSRHHILYAQFLL